MFRVKKFLSLTAIVIGGLIGASMLTYFSFAQNYDELIKENLIKRVLHFMMPEHNVYLYAVTEANTYRIVFDENWGTWSMSGMDMVFNEAKKPLLANTFTKDWFIFNWWSTNKTWPVEYSDQELVNNLTTENDVDVVLYAQRTGWGIPYTALYWLEDLEWWDEYVGSEVLYSAEETVCILTWKIFTWFKLQTGACFPINPDWTTEVTYNYTRNEYDLILMDRGEEILNTKVKYEADIISILSGIDLTWWERSTFSWWQWVPEWGKMPAESLIITSEWNDTQYVITFDTDGWTNIPPFTGKYGDPIPYPDNPTKPWYEFVGWEPELPATISWENITVKAIWKKVKEDGWWTGWSWWWGGWGWWWGWDWWESSNEPSWEEEHGSAINQTTWTNDRADLEVLIAYMWARNKWIIDTSRKDSDPDGYIPRWDMAELVVKFTENVLWRTIPAKIPAKCSRWDPDREWKSPQTKVYAEKACALWVMWIRMQNFMPNKILDRAEFWTILSRLLWWAKYDVVDATETKLYYTRHLAALNNAWIMKQIDNPVDRKELRKWAWLMLMRVKF